MIGQIRYFYQADMFGICLAVCSEFVTVAFWGAEGHALGLQTMQTRFWDRPRQRVVK